MNQQERFEAFYAKQHDIDPEDVAGYRIEETYGLPKIAAHYRTFKGAEDGLLAITSKVVIDCSQWTDYEIREMAEVGREPFTPNILKTVAP